MNLHKVTQGISLLEEARRVLRIESEALKVLGECLDESFEEVVRCLHHVEGRVIISGMGKSGHVARKIAGTLSSTGTPSFFVHPAEASHGDLGMITQNDAVIALSNGGETTELHDIISHAKRFQIPIIAITSNAASALGKAADYVLKLPKQQEACPMGLAPTTSTTMMMALGDALAVALMAEKKFSKEAYNVFHPGGLLGRKLIKIEDIMHKGNQIPLAFENTFMSEAMLIMTDKRLGCVGILDSKQELVGSITDGDLRRHMSPDLLQKKAYEIMKRHPQNIHVGSLVVEAIALMNQKAIRHLFVVDGPKVVGVVEIHDCLRRAG
jgi:arabinose-5-phosphate isomerase